MRHENNNMPYYMKEYGLDHRNLTTRNKNGLKQYFYKGIRIDYITTSGVSIKEILRTEGKEACKPLIDACLRSMK